MSKSPAGRKLPARIYIIGEQASELIHTACVFMRTAGPIDALTDAVYNYPTLSDSFQYASYDGL